MTRTEFIQNYARRSLDQSPQLQIETTEDGIRFAGSRRYALPCTCGEDGCEGWAMISEQHVAEHRQRHGDET